MFRHIRLSPIRWAIVIFVLCAFLQFKATANSVSGDWINTDQLALSRQAAVKSLPSSLNGNIDCITDGDNDCVVSTRYGLVSPNSEVKLNDSKNYAPIYSYIDSQRHFIPIPNSGGFMTYTANPSYGLQLYFNYNFSADVGLIDSGLGSQYQINQPPDAPLQDFDRHKLAADYNSMSFSQNGDWMVVAVPNVAMVRVNLITLDVMPFAPSFSYTIGVSPAAQTSITNDGRYAVVEAKDFNSFKVYDLNTCDSVPTTVTGPVNCGSRDIQTFMNQQIPGFVSASNIRFMTNDGLSFYVTSNFLGQQSINKYFLSTSGNQHGIGYLALGDSYISGEGAFDYLPATDTANNRCHVSLLSYPYLLGYDLNFNSYHSVACSGATIRDILNTSLDYGGQASPKVLRKNLSDGQLQSILENFQQGYIDQLDFVSKYQPQVITLSVGGNDMGFSQILKSCVAPSLNQGTCYSSYEDRLKLVRMIENQVFPKLLQTYQTLKASGPPDMRLYIIGYPQIAQADGDCAVNVHLDKAELEFANQLVSYLDSVIKVAADRSGVYYVDTESALDGHKLCQAGPGSVAINGLTAGNDTVNSTLGPFGDESYHPNAFGHELLENAVLVKTNKLTNPMPVANNNIHLPDESGLQLLNTPKTGEPVDMAVYDNSISDDVLFKQTNSMVQVSGIDHALRAEESMRAVLHSDEVKLGDYQADSNGNLVARITLPGNVPAGYHTLHFYGLDLAGQSLDIYKQVYVAESLRDMDGDQVDDVRQACIGVAPIGQDTDKDGIDDSCDGIIGAPPLPMANGTQEVVLLANNVTKQSEMLVSASSPTGKVLSAKIINASNSDQKNSLTTFSAHKIDDSRTVVIAAALSCVWIVVLYAAWEFR